MTEITANDSSKKPGVVIFVAILNFLSAFFSGSLLVISILGLIFGSAVGVSDYVAQQITQYSPATVSYGFVFIFILLGLFSAFFTAFFLIVALGLLRGKKFAWYSQVAMSVLGLFFFPFHTVLNAIILVFFFQAPVRNYFKV